MFDTGNPNINFFLSHLSRTFGSESGRFIKCSDDGPDTLSVKPIVMYFGDSRGFVEVIISEAISGLPGR